MNLEIDGATVKFSGAIRIASDYANILGDTVGSVKVSFDSVESLSFLRGTLPDTLHSFRYASGLLGLSYGSLRRLSCPSTDDPACTQFRRLARFGTNYASKFSLDLGRQPPRLIIGNLSGKTLNANFLC
jgi:hypothetical protein